MKRFLSTVTTIKQHDYNKRLKECLIPERGEINTLEKDDLNRGHAIFDAIRYCLSIVDEQLPRSEEQVKIHDLICSAATSFVYGKSLYSNEIKIKEYNHFASILPGILLTAPRRFGKTFSIAIIIIVFFLNIPYIEVVVIAQAKRSAGSDVGILGLVRKLLATCFNFVDSDMDRKNEEHIIAKFNENDIRKISSYSSGSGDK